jgi:D-cysteine desulfhydrase family pyridoxal phosphate-dependent enzyme
MLKKMINLNDFPRIKIAFLPTPIHKLENLSKELNRNIYIKRDDLTGFGFGGNKIRKLEFLLADAKSKNSDVILTPGAVQSNHCRLTAALASKLGFEVHLILGGKKPKKFTGNLLLDKLVEAKLHFIETNDWDILNEKMLKISNELEGEGKKPYPIPIGGSVPLGALGYVIAAKEIKKQSESMGIKFSHIFHASSSGGTQSGLEIGKRIFGLNSTKIIGIGVSKKDIRKTVFEITNETRKLMKSDFSMSIDEIKVDMNYVGKGYGIKTKGCVEAVNLLARKEAIFLDYVYTGKAMSALIDYYRKKKLSKEDNILFIHTGGNVELFA